MTKSQMRKRCLEAGIKMQKVAFMFKGSAGNYSTLSAKDRKELLAMAEKVIKIADKLK